MSVGQSGGVLIRISFFVCGNTPAGMELGQILDEIQIPPIVVDGWHGLQFLWFILEEGQRLLKLEVERRDKIHSASAQTQISNPSNFQDPQQIQSSIIDCHGMTQLARQGKAQHSMAWHGQGRGRKQALPAGQTTHAFSQVNLSYPSISVSFSHR